MTHTHYLKVVENFLTKKKEANQLLGVSTIRVVYGKDDPELLGYRVSLVRETAPQGRRDALGINVDDPLETEFVELSREYGKLNFESHKSEKGCDVLIYFLDPFVAAFRLTRDPFSGPREYVTGLSHGAELEGAEWTVNQAQGDVFRKLNASLVHSMLKKLRASKAGSKFVFGRNYIHGD